MTRSALVAMTCAVGVVVGAGCSGRAKAKPARPALAEERPAQPVPEPGPGPMIAEPVVDPTAIPAETLATISVGDPGALLMDFGAYLTTAGFTGAPQMLASSAAMMGFAFDQPIAVIVVMGDQGPEPVLAGTPGTEDAVHRFAQMSGRSAEIENGVAVIARLELHELVGPHLRWRLAQPVAPELRFEIASEMLNRAIALASAALPNNPLAGFDSLEKLAGSVMFDANDATLKLAVGARAGTGLEKFTASLAPSDFRLAGAVAAPGDALFGAGTLDYVLIADGLRSWLGPVIDLWRAVADATDGAVAIAFHDRGSMVGVLGVKAGATEAATAGYEQAVRGMAAPVVMMNTSTVGRLRVKKIGKQWFHEIESSLTADATDADREAMQRMYGAESVRSLVGVLDGVAIQAMGKTREKAIGEVARRAKPGAAPAVRNPGALAAVDEARRANEAFVMTGDLATFVGWMMPDGVGVGAGAGAGAGKAGKKAPPPSASRPLFRVGMGRVGDSLGLRFVMPAAQLSTFREMAESAGAATP